MHVEIMVTNPAPDSDTSPFNFSYAHVGCVPGALKWSRDQINDICTITCACGLAVSFPQQGPATTVIARTCIDGIPCELADNSFTSPQAKTVRVLSGDAA